MEISSNRIPGILNSMQEIILKIRSEERRVGKV